MSGSFKLSMNLEAWYCRLCPAPIILLSITPETKLIVKSMTLKYLLF